MVDGEEAQLQRGRIKADVLRCIAEDAGVSKESGSEQRLLVEIEQAIDSQLARANKRGWRWKQVMKAEEKAHTRARFKRESQRQRRNKALDAKAVEAVEAEHQRWKELRKQQRKLSKEIKRLKGKSFKDPGKWQPTPMFSGKKQDAISFG